MPNHPQTNTSLIVLACLLVITQVGCVALNIPSHRYHDADDHGGAFGSWRSSDGIRASDSQIRLSDDESAVAYSSDGGLCGDPACEGCDGCAGLCGTQNAAKPPEIPWPRFHPVPTRPVFGSKTPF